MSEPEATKANMTEDYQRTGGAIIACSTVYEVSACDVIIAAPNSEKLKAMIEEMLCSTADESKFHNVLIYKGDQ